MLWDHYVLRVTCQLSVEPYSGFCVSRVSRCDHSGEMRREEDLQPGKNPSSSAYVPPARDVSRKKKSQTGSDFFIFIKPTMRKSRMNNVSFDRWCWSKPMKEGTDDKSDVTVRHSQLWLRLTINTVYRRSSKTVERTAVLCCRSCPFQLVPTEEILFFFFSWWFAVESFMSTQALKMLRQPLTFWPSLPEITLTFFFWFQKCLFLASEQSLLSPLRVRDSREGFSLKTVIFSLARTSFPS